jgi:metal-responsive CopG/Arc/MetJ family transcriptional regulator
MKRTTISLPDDLAQAVDREARRRRVSVSEITREALQARLRLEPGQTRELPFAALGRSGHATTARDIEKLLEQEWNDDARRR